MGKPKAPRWLTEAFAQGVDEQVFAVLAGRRADVGAYPGADPLCWLAQYDPRCRPCSGRMERFHFVPRQRAENAIWGQLVGAVVEEPCELCRGSGCNPNNVLAACPGCDGYRTWRAPMLNGEAWEIIHVVGWDHRNGAIGCEHHHRRFDGHATSARAPKIVVPFAQLPGHVLDYVDDYGFRDAGWLVERFPG